LEQEQTNIKQNQEESIPNILHCIAYLSTVIFITIFLFYVSQYFWLRVYTTEGATTLLKAFGFDTTVTYIQAIDVVQICANGDCFWVIKICSGIEAIALLTGLILATPTSWERKIFGTLFISFGIFGANILRIVTTVVLATQGYDPYIYHELVSAIFTITFIIAFLLMIQAWIIPNFIDSLINVMIGIVRAVKRI